MILDSDIQIMINMILWHTYNRYWSTLTAAAWHRSTVIFDEVTSFYLRQNKKPRREAYPAVVSACCTKYKNSKVYVDNSRDPCVTRFDFRLRSVICMLGEIGKPAVRRSKCKFILGRCAEQQVANALLKDQKQALLGDIYFGDAFRPRTGEYMAPCENCQLIFPNL